jgi:signal peptidase I
MHEAPNPPETTPAAPPPRPHLAAPARPSTPRRAAEVTVLCVCLLLILRRWGVEPYEVPTGSMAPALAGHHRARTCPRCGHPVLVGRHPHDTADGPAPARLYRGAHCPNCGHAGLDMHAAPLVRGDHLFVNRSVFSLRLPRRWEMVVFRLFGIIFVKRIIGLPGELLEIREGDVYVNGELERKTLSELRSLAVPVFDNDHQPAPPGWRPRWEASTDPGAPHPLSGAELRLSGLGSKDRYQTVTYRNYNLDSRQCEPLGDEYAYNGGERSAPLPVHDFLMEANLEVTEGTGWVLLGITDGRDRLVVEILAGDDDRQKPGQPRLGGVRSWPPKPGEDPRPLPSAVQAPPAREVQLRVGEQYLVELAFADRRLTLAVNGKTVLGPVDLPAAGGRSAVVRPVVLGARGVNAVVRNFHLFRDIHYTNAGPNARPGKAVHLGPEQYFVLGDNSPNSQDSRFWPDGGAVPARALLGKPFVVHLPGPSADGKGEAREVRGTDWGRLRWIR